MHFIVLLAISASQLLTFLLRVPSVLATPGPCVYNSALLIVCLSAGKLFDHEDGGSAFPRNFIQLPLDYTAQHPRRE
jgi:hypothetical protein